LIGDPGRLRQIIMNLVGNAIKFTGAGEIVIKVDCANTDGTCCKTGKDVDSKNEEICELLFSVHDTGIGLPVHKKDKLFHAFTQADSSTTREYGGTGLGLSISKKIVEMMNGKIWVESPSSQHLNHETQLEKTPSSSGNGNGTSRKKTKGPGSTFYFTAQFNIANEEINQFDFDDLVDLQKKRILVVDDNFTNRRILSEMLRNFDMITDEVENGEQALIRLEDACKSNKPYALIMIDSSMPTIDGFTLAENIKRSNFSGQTIMMLTASGQRGDAARCRELGISAYLTKPIGQSDLLDAIITIFNTPQNRHKKKITGKYENAECSSQLVTRHSLREKKTIQTKNTEHDDHILVVEDNKSNQMIVEHLLKKMGLKTVIVQNGKEAVDIFVKEKFDLIFMDIQMPIMDGYEATAEIRRLEEISGKHIPIIALTAHSMKGDKEKCIRAKMDDYLPKPIHIKELQLILDKWLIGLMNSEKKKLERIGEYVNINR
jgi:CheY-like chemotaxis protein